MPEKDPTIYSLFTYAWVTAISMLGGFVNFAHKVKLGLARAFNVVELFGELMTSAFVGLLAFWMCEAAGLSQIASAPLIGISGHMGTRALFLMEAWADRKFRRMK
jgi:hypothetical protein